MASETVPMVQPGTSAMRYSATAAQSNQTAALADEGFCFEADPNQTVVVSNASTQMSYTIDFDTSIGSGGYARVFGARDSEGNEYAAKISLRDRDARHNSDYQRVIKELLDITGDPSNGGCQSTHLMPIYAFESKAINVQTSDRPGWHEELAYVAVMPICSRLDEKPLEKGYLKRCVISDVATALHFLHERNIVHRDVKPSNLFVYDSCVVLGDFNISSFVEGSAEGQKFGYTTTQRATVGYSIPGVPVQPESDWYAFGYTIWTLYNDGKHPYQSLIEANDQLALQRIALSGSRDVPFQPTSDEDKYLGRLIYGLTYRDHKKRLGFEAVMSWVDKPESITWVDPDDGETGWSYQFEGKTYTDFAELAEALSNNWSVALRQFSRGYISQSFVGDGQIDAADALDTYRNSSESSNLGLAKSIWYLSGNRHLLCWEGKDVSFTNLIANIDNPEVSKELLAKDLLASGLLSWAAEQQGSGVEAILSPWQTEDQLSDGKRYVIEKLRGIEKVAAQLDDGGDASFARLLFKNAFSANYTDSLTMCQNADKLFELCSSTPYRFYQTIASKDAYRSMLSVAYRFTDADSLLGMLKAYPNDSAPSDDLTRGHELLVLATEALCFFEGLVESKDIVREFYINYGPIGPWVWTARHADMYLRMAEGSSAPTRFHWSCDTITKGLSSSVAQMAHDGFEQTAHTCVQRIEANLEELPLRHYYGISSEKNVTVSEDDGFFCARFYGETVPRGFVRDIFTASKTDMTGTAEWDGVCLVEASQGDSRDKNFEKTIMELQKRMREQCESKAGYLLGSLLLLAAFAACGTVMAPSLFEFLVLLGLPEGFDYVLAFGAFVSAVTYFAYASFYYLGRQRLSGKYRGLDKDLKQLSQTYNEDIRAYGEKTSPFYMRLADQNASLPVVSYGYSSTVALLDKNLHESQGLHNSGHWAMWGMSTILPMMLAGGLIALGVWEWIETSTSYSNRFATGMVIGFLLWLVGLWYANSKSWCGPHFWLAMVLLPPVFCLAAVFVILIVGGILTIAAGILALVLGIVVIVSLLDS